MFPSPERISDPQLLPGFLMEMQRNFSHFPGPKRQQREVVLQISREVVWPMGEPQEQTPLFWISGLSQTPKTSSAVLCLLWHPLHNECDQPEGVQKPWICGNICFTERELKLCVFDLLMKSADGLLIVY